jgi:hypothetical protein
MQVLVPYAITTAVLTTSSVAESDYPVWSAATYYAAGARVIRTATHRIYERVLPGTTTTAPELDPTNWDDLAPTNCWAMFDEAIGTVTSATTSISVTLAIAGPVGDVVLLGVTGSSVTATLPDRTRTVSVPAPAIAGQGSTVQILGLASAGGACQITLTGTGTVGIGTVCVGTFVTVGATSTGLAGELQDFSRKEFDEFGGLTIVRRAYQRRLQVPLVIDRASIDQAVRVLAACRSRPALWKGLSTLAATLVYGYGRDWSLAVPAGSQTSAQGQLTVQSMALGV